MKIILWYLAYLVPISICLAVFEIWLEGFKKGSWGKTEFDHPLWGKKIQTPVFLEYITPYHIVIFGMIIPSITGIIFFDCGINMTTVAFVIAIWIGNSVLEDFLWFAIQSLTGWREPQALHRLLAGNFAWHKNWISLPSGIKIPTWYAVGTMIVTSLLVFIHLINS